MAFKLKHKGAAALMKSLSAMPKPVRKMPVQKAPVKKDPDPGTKKKKTESSSSNSMFPERGTLEEREMMKKYKEADSRERARLRREFAGRQLESYGETAGDEGYKQMRAREKELTAKYTQQFGDPAEKGIGPDERLSRMDAIRSNVAKDVGRADYRTNRSSKDSPEYSQAMSKYRSEAERLGKIYDLRMRGKSYDRYKKQPTETAGAAPKKVKGMGPVRKTGVGTKSIKERIYEDGRKKKKANTAKRATMTKKMYKK